MMFDVVKLRAQVTFRNVEYTREFVLEVADLRGVADTIAEVSKKRCSRAFCFLSFISFRPSGRLTSSARRSVENLLVQVRRRIARDTDVVHVLESHACFFETVTNRLRGETRAVLDAVEAFFLDRGDQSAVFDDCR